MNRNGSDGRTRETWEEAVCRLASLARERGIAIYCYDLGEAVEFFATSTSRPGTLHRVTMFSCDCQGFIKHQRCTHHARLLDEVGELPTPPATPQLSVVTAPGETPEPSPTFATIICFECEGVGTVTKDDRYGDPWDVTCGSCRGRGTREIVAVDLEPAALERTESGDLLGVPCRACSGEGFRKMQTGGRLSDWEAVACRACRGAGLVPVPANADPFALAAAA